MKKNINVEGITMEKIKEIIKTLNINDQIYIESYCEDPYGTDPNETNGLTIVRYEDEYHISEYDADGGEYHDWDIQLDDVENIEEIGWAIEDGIILITVDTED